MPALLPASGTCREAAGSTSTVLCRAVPPASLGAATTATAPCRPLTA